PYRSWLRFFSPTYRRDRRAIARRSLAGVMPPTAWDDVPRARDLLRDRDRLRDEAAQRKAILGRYEKGLDTDFDAAERATRVAAEVLELVQKLGHAAVPEKLIEDVSRGTPPPEKIRAAMKRLHDSLGPWAHTCEELEGYLPLTKLPETGQKLTTVPCRPSVITPTNCQPTSITFLPLPTRS